MFNVIITEYRLDQNHVGELTGRCILWSQHRSKKAAGRVLGSLISGKHAKSTQPPRGFAYHYQVTNADTGECFARNDCY